MKWLQRQGIGWLGWVRLKPKAWPRFPMWVGGPNTLAIWLPSSIFRELDQKYSTQVSKQYPYVCFQHFKQQLNLVIHKTNPMELVSCIWETLKYSCSLPQREHTWKLRKSGHKGKQPWQISFAGQQLWQILTHLPFPLFIPRLKGPVNLSYSRTMNAWHLWLKPTA